MKVSNDFWSTLTDKAYWQVIFALLVAFFTASLTNLFKYVFDRRKENKKIVLKELSNFRRYSYELIQKSSNRYQCEIYTYYYRCMHELTQDSEYLEQQKNEIRNMPQYSTIMSEAHGTMLSSMSILQQTLPPSSLIPYKSLIDSVTNIRKYPIIDPKKFNNELDGINYWQQNTNELRMWIEAKIKKPTDDLYRLYLNLIS